MSGLLEPLVVGVIQALAWIWPLSSSGHLALLRLLFGVEARDATLRLLVHAGLLVAVLWYVRGRVREALVAAVGAFARPRLLVTTPGGQDALLVLLALLATVPLRLALSSTAADWTHSPWAIGVGLGVTAGVLLSTQWVGRGSVEFPGWGTALLLGMGQGLAVLPGVSRTAVTIGIALWCGVQRGRAFELSLLIGLPVLVGAFASELPSVLASPGNPLPALFAGALATLVGSGALRLLERSVRSGWFPWFALWVGPLAIATLAMARAWPAR